MRGNNQIARRVNIDADSGAGGRDVSQQRRVRRVGDVHDLNSAGSVRHKCPVAADRHIVSGSRGVVGAGKDGIERIADVVNPQSARTIRDEDFPAIDLSIIGLSGGINRPDQHGRAAVADIHDMHA